MGGGYRPHPSERGVACVIGEWHVHTSLTIPYAAQVINDSRRLEQIGQDDSRKHRRDIQTIYHRVSKHRGVAFITSSPPHTLGT